MPNITKSYVDGLKCRDAAYIKWDSKVPGFGVKVYAKKKTNRCTKSFVLRYSNAVGKRRMETLGVYGPMTPTQARERAEQRVVEIREGVDPLADKKAKRLAVASDDSTFRQVVDLFIERYAKPRQRSWALTQRVLEANCARWLDRSIGSITQAEVQELLDEFLAGGQPAKARVTHSWLKTFFGWAYRRGILEHSVVDRVEIHIESKVRVRTYSDDEIKSVWEAANELEGIEGGFVKLILLLGVRKSELAGMKRIEFDAPANPTVWTVPHERVKIRKSATAKRAYIVPLPPLTQRIIKSLPRSDNELLFPGSQTGKALIPGPTLRRKIWKLSGVDDWGYHACRHTIATWLENEGHSEYERGLVLNHSAYGVTAGYSHGYPTDLKRQLLEKWADHVAGIVQPKGVAVLS
jgi:integrase